MFTCLVLVYGPQRVGLGSDSVWVHDKYLKYNLFWKKKWGKYNWTIRLLGQWFGRLMGMEKDLGPQLYSLQALVLCAITQTQDRTTPIMPDSLLAETFSRNRVWGVPTRTVAAALVLPISWNEKVLKAGIPEEFIMPSSLPSLGTAPSSPPWIGVLVDICH